MIVNYICDICNNGIVDCIDSSSYEDDNGDTHIVYTHKCRFCNAVCDIEDIKYPRYEIIPSE